MRVPVVLFGEAPAKRAEGDSRTLGWKAMMRSLRFVFHLDSKALAEVRSAELENVRLAARLVAGEREDPDVDRKVVIEGATATVLPQS